jgi:hypothetical protein
LTILKKDLYCSLFIKNPGGEKMQLSLTRHERAVIDEWKKFGVLQNVADHILDQKNGVILITCSDADQFDDVFRHQCGMQTTQREKPRIHTFAWHGGPLACAPCSRICGKRKHAHLIFLDQISDAHHMKEISVVASRAHAPCGAVRMNQIAIEEEMAIHMRAKQQMKTLNEGITVAPFLDVDYGDRKRTYFIFRERWEAWADEHNIPSVA